MTSPTMTWTRVARALGTDHNPLRRRLDLVAAWLAPAAIALFLVLGPVAAGGAVIWAHASNAAARQAASRLRPATAVLLAPASGPLMTDGGSNSWLTLVQARWQADGRPHSGPVPAVSGTRAGATVPVWLDAAGHVRAPPLTASQATDRVITAAGAAVAALAIVLTVLALAGRVVLNRRRLAAWDADWRVTAPRWSHPG